MTKIHFFILFTILQYDSVFILSVACHNKNQLKICHEMFVIYSHFFFSTNKEKNYCLQCKYFHYILYIVRVPYSLVCVRLPIGSGLAYSNQLFCVNYILYVHCRYRLDRICDDIWNIVDSYCFIQFSFVPNTL